MGIAGHVGGMTSSKHLLPAGNTQLNILAQGRIPCHLAGHDGCRRWGVLLFRKQLPGENSGEGRPGLTHAASRVAVVSSGREGSSTGPSHPPVAAFASPLFVGFSSFSSVLPRAGEQVLPCHNLGEVR